MKINTFNMEEYIKKLRKLRTEKGYSQEYMANELELSASGYRKIENGESKMKLETLIKAAKLLETDIFEFLQDEKTINIQSNNTHCQNIQGGFVDGEKEAEALREIIKAKDEIIELLKKQIAQGNTNM